MAAVIFSDVYDDITIEYTANAQFVAGEQADCVRLVKEGIDKGFFTAPIKYNKVRITAGAHPFTVYSTTGEKVDQQAHITGQCYTGGAGQYRVHIWLLPVDTLGAKATTTLDPAKPPTFIKK